MFTPSALQALHLFVGVFLWSCAFTTRQGQRAEAANVCELRGCPARRPGHINMHVLSHSHNDAGWIQTVDTLYEAYVESIYNTSTRALGMNPTWRYVSAENVFFARWWRNQSARVQERVRAAVGSGQLQFVGGGWVQNDEAVTHYTAIIDQMTLGLRFLNDTFGPQCGVPSVAWQADPFGHSIAQAALFSRMGFSSLMLGRISWDTKDEWQRTHALEFIWQADSRQQGKSSCLTPCGDEGHILAWVPRNSYETPPVICLTWRGCEDVSARLAGSSWETSALIKYARDQANVYTNDTVSMMSGGDLTFVAADWRFQKQDSVIEQANKMSPANKEGPPVHVVHSTPACYVEALHEAIRSWPSFTGDLLPYADQPGRSWTGFYTTRPNLKMMVRYANGFLQASKQLSVLGLKDVPAEVKALGEAVATLQHHDGITGTCTDDVAQDYANMLYQGIKGCEKVISTSVTSLLNPGAANVDEIGNKLHFCHLLNQSDCEHTKETEFGVIVYNPASVPISPYVHLPLEGDGERLTIVTGPKGAKVESQAVSLAPHRHGIQESSGDAKQSLVFQAEVDPLGASLYHVKVGPAHTSRKSPENYLQLDEAVNFIENERYHITWDPNTGLLSSVLLHGSKVSVQLRQTFAAYLFERAAPENVSMPGHYVFTATNEAQELGDQVTYRIITGPLVQEIHQIFNNYISQVITLHSDSPFIEFTWTVGPLTELMAEPTKQSFTGCDVISKFDSDLRSEGFYADSNGWKDVHRTAAVREGDKWPISSHYYPVASWIYIQDKAKDLQMVVLPDRAQGGTSLRKGHIELMLHRYHMTNDDLGNPETIEETSSDGQGLVARGKHFLFLGTASEARQLLRPQALQLVYRPVLVFAPAGWQPKQEKFSTLRSSLPSTVHVLTLERLSPSQVLLRLEHLGLTDAPVDVNVTRLLAGHRLNDIQPLTLGANQYLPGATRHRWPVQRPNATPHPLEDIRMDAPQTTLVGDTGDTVVKVVPGQIATFLATQRTE
ncbi:lysosomal alpha-mannosidase-like [Amblyomma americanum]